MGSKEAISSNAGETTGNTGWENMEYRKVDTREYVEAGLADGSLEVFEAVKHARISAVRGEVGQKVISWSEDENGNPIQEKVATVTADKETGETGWIATKTDADGNPIIDKNGHANQWIISDETFRKKYEVDPDHPDIFKPVGAPQKFVETKEALTIDEMNMPKGSFINITNPDDMYAINPRDFHDTYTPKLNQYRVDYVDHATAFDPYQSPESGSIVVSAKNAEDARRIGMERHIRVTSVKEISEKSATSKNKAE